MSCANCCGALPMSRQKALCVYVPLLVISFAVICAFPALNMQLCATITGVLFWTAVYLQWCATEENCRAQYGGRGSGPAAEALVADAKQRDPEIEGEKQTAKTGRRMYYLDNLKAMLTGIVVLHHCTCAFAGSGWFYNIADYNTSFRYFGLGLQIADQSYFMVLFFFISAYFTPGSFARKGVLNFMRDKFKRLGIPYLAFTLVLGPLLIFFIAKVCVGSGYTYGPVPGPTWFIFWLLIFNSVYATIRAEDTPSEPAALPSFPRALAAAAGLGLIQAAGMAVTSSFLSMPLTFGSLPFDIMAFWLGTKAKRGQWLREGLPNFFQSTIAGRNIRKLAVLFGLGCWAIAYFFTLYVVPSNGCSRDRSTSDAKPGNGGLLVLGIFGGGIVLGAACLVFILAAFSLAQEYLDFSTPLSREIARSAYAVYIIHPWAIVPLTYAWVRIMEDREGESILFPDKLFTSHSCIDNEYLIWAGWAFVTIGSILTSWGVAVVLRRLPGFRQVL